MAAILRARGESQWRDWIDISISTARWAGPAVLGSIAVVVDSRNINYLHFRITVIEHTCAAAYATRSQLTGLSAGREPQWFRRLTQIRKMVRTTKNGQNNELL